MIAVRGVTAEERKAARARRTALRRAAMYRELLGQAKAEDKQGEQLRHLCDYLRAIANDLPDEKMPDLIAEVAAIADKWSNQ